MTRLTAGMSVQVEDIAHWRVTCNEVVSGAETVSFTVVIRRKENATVGDVQVFAMRRAMELLEATIQSASPPGTHPA